MITDSIVIINSHVADSQCLVVQHMITSCHLSDKNCHNALIYCLGRNLANKMHSQYHLLFLPSTHRKQHV